MEPFTDNILTILTLISICWTGVTCLIAIIFGLIFFYRYCIKNRRPKFIKPIQTPSILSDDQATIPVTPIQNKSSHNQQQQRHTIHRYESPSIVDEYSYSNHSNKYQQQDSMHDENDETTAKNENRTYIQHQSKRPYQSIKPITNLRISDRHTPYPADVLARERLMNNTKFPMDNNKY